MAGDRDLASPTPGEEDEVFFKNYVPPARDAIHLPIHIFYLILAFMVIVATLYAIIGHLIKDLVHDFAGDVCETPQLTVLTRQQDQISHLLNKVCSSVLLVCFFTKL